MFQDRRKVVPLLIHNCSKWSELEAAGVVCSTYKLYLRNSMTKKEAAAELLLILRKQSLPGHWRAQSVSSQPFLLGCARSLKIAHKEFPNRYYGMASVKSQDNSANKWGVLEVWVDMKRTGSNTVAINVWLFMCKVSKNGFKIQLFISIISISSLKKTPKSKMYPKMTTCLPLTVKLLKSCWASHYRTLNYGWLSAWNLLVKDDW